MTASMMLDGAMTGEWFLAYAEQVLGATLSPGDVFGGRPSARSIHFITASLLVAFVVVHMLMALLSGPWNNMRSMVTGREAIKLKEAGQ
jgi:thiosulfate reductase cytochrome b subunit